MNLKTKVIVKDIINLTDARYFAAWGVDYISFEADKNSDVHFPLEDVREVMGWVAGPQYLLSFSGVFIDQQDANHWITELEIEDVILSNFVSETDLPNVRIIREIFVQDIDPNVQNGSFILKVDDIATLDSPKIKAFIQHNDVYIDGHLSKDQIEALLMNYEVTGIVLRGGEEEKVGVKTFDQLDDIFEMLEIEE